MPPTHVFNVPNTKMMLHAVLEVRWDTDGRTAIPTNDLCGPIFVGQIYVGQIFCGPNLKMFSRTAVLGQILWTFSVTIFGTFLWQNMNPFYVPVKWQPVSQESVHSVSFYNLTKNYYIFKAFYKMKMWKTVKTHL